MSTSEKNRFILIGLNNLGIGIAKVFTESGAEITAIDRRRDLLLKVLPFAKHNVLVASDEFSELNHMELEAYAGIIVVITADLPFSLASVAFLEKKGIKNLHVCVENEDQAKIAAQLGVASVTRMDSEIGHLLAAKLLDADSSDH